MNKENLDKRDEDQELIKEAVRKTCEKYDYDDQIMIQSVLEEVLEEFGSLDNLKGKRILDLGCGHVVKEENASNIKILKTDSFEKDKYKPEDLQKMHSLVLEENAYDSLISENREFEPWLCRVLKELGAEPVGIDIGNLEGEEFEHYQIDLTKKGALDFLPSESFDLIFSRLLASSPQLEFMIDKGEIDILMVELEKQANRLMKVGGKVKIDKGF